MKSKYSSLLTALLIAGIQTVTFAQEANDGYPEIGKPCPDFVLKEVQYHAKKQMSLQDLKGKHVILDFFSSGCASCVEAFPKTNKLYQEHKNDVEIILVGKEDKWVRPMYEKFRQKQQLNLPVVFDSALCNRWVPAGYPHLIWIDKEGIVRAITSSSDLKQENLQAFLTGKDFVYFDRSYASNQKRSDGPQTEMESANINDNDVLSASILSNWGGRSDQRALDQFRNGERTFDARCMILQWLYNLAYVGKISWYAGDSLYGKFANEPVLEIADKTPFEYNFSAKTNLYNYCLIVPKTQANTAYMQEQLQKDLKKTFGFDVSVENRKFPIWKLVATEAARKKLKTKGGKAQFEGIPYASFSATNMSVKSLIGMIWAHQQMGPDFVDETGIEGNIDLKMDCVMTDLEAVRKELQKNGLDLVKAEREMKALVIRDSK